MIDPATGWFEIQEITDPDSDCASRAFDDAWLSRYPRPQYVGVDNGSENQLLFRQMCKNMGLKTKRTSSHNPQSNGIVERVHAVLWDMIRTFELEDQELDKEDPWGEFLSSAAFAIRATHHSVLECSPAQAVFGRDMILPVRINADWERIRQHRQRQINQNNSRENSKRVAHI